jgi:hypothetical protein
MKVGARTSAAVTSVAVALFLVFVLSSTALAAATPAPAAGTPQTLWAYGYVKTVSVGPLKTADGWVYQGSATVGYSVILNQTNTSSTTFELSVARTMGVLFSVEFCFPSCVSPTAFNKLSYHAYEQTDAWANFTTQGTVTGPSGAQPAIALENTHTTVYGNLTESAHSVLPSGGITGAAGTLVDRSKYLGGEVTSDSSITFATPLGLIPRNLTNAESWTATSAFNASGSANYSYYYHAAGPVVNKTIGPVSGALTVSRSGNVTVEGTYAPQNTVSFGGVTYPALELTVQGPFSVREGFILVPASVDLFGGSSTPWAEEQNGSGTVAMTYLDAKATVGGHVGIAASSWLYSLAATNAADAAPSGSGGLAPAVAAVAEPVAATSVQGTPQTVSQAQSNQACLTTGVGCPAASSAPNLRGLFGELAAVGIAGVVVLVIAIVLVTERRRVPPPVYPNAGLYPPGSGSARPPAPAAGAPGSPPAPPAEDDPLDHLW